MARWLGRGPAWWRGRRGRADGKVTNRDDVLDEIVEQVETVEEVRDEIIEYEDNIVEEAVTYAKSIAPVWAGQESQGRHPGTFRDSIRGERTDDKDGMPAAMLISEDEKAAFIEYGTAKTPEHGTFAKTAAHFNDLETHI